eukprot:PhF_6_TR24971/c0_g1_i1/m.34359
MVKRMTPDAVLASVQRLHHPIPRKATPGLTMETLQEGRKFKLKKKDLESSIHRLYNVGLQHKFDKEKSHIAVGEQKDPVKKLTSEDVDSAVQRLFVTACQHRETVRELLRRKYLANVEERAVTPEVGAMAKHSVQNLYYEELQRETKKEEKLKKRYVEGTLPPSRPRSAAEWGDTLSRLYVVKK